MSKINKLINSCSEYQFILNDILRNLEMIKISSPEGLRLQKEWEENINEYGEIKYIFKQSLMDSPESKYHIICARYCPEDKILYNSSWCIQILG